MPDHSPILQSVWRHAEEHPDKVALIWNDTPVTYAGLRQNICRAAAYLQSQGVSAGDCVGISAKKGLEFVYIYLGGQLLGAVNVVLDPEANEARLEYIKSVTRPKLIVDCAAVQLPESNIQKLKQSDSSLSPDSAAEIVFTTGTIGAAKGVVLSHANIFGSASNINSFIGNGSNEVEILGLPLCHSFGLGRLRCTLLRGATLVVLPSFANVKLFFAAIEKYHATGFGMVPAIWAYIRKFGGTRISKYASQIRYIEIGSAAMPLESKKELCEIFPTTRICHHYGLTEASRATFMEYHECIEDLTTIGRESSDKVQIKIFDENGVEVPDGQDGEMCIRGNMVMKGYFKPEENKTAYFGEYFRTGDGGRRGSNGNLYLVSRIKEMINVGGKKVSPVEVEDVVLSMGGVEDCAAVGIPDPDGILGEVVKLYVQKPNCTRTFDEIAAFIKSKLEQYKLPVAYDWVDEVPKTKSGKKQRLQLKK